MFFKPIDTPSLINYSLLMTETINSIKDLFEHIELSGPCYFRGISGDPEIFMKPSIHRHSMTPVFRTRMETSFLKDFYNSSYSFFKKPLSLWDQLIYSQHYGAPSRLLDWTINPLIALYFAVENENHHKYSSLYFLGTSNLNSSIYSLPNDYEDIYPSPFEIKSTIFIKPKSLFIRMSVQSSIFSVHPANEDIIPYKNLRCFKISKPAKIKETLNNMSINRGSLFPDIDGAGANTKYNFNNLVSFANEFMKNNSKA